MEKCNSIHTSTKWCSRKDEHDANGKGKKYAQWCKHRMKILGMGNRYNMLFDQLIIYINIG
jgi:hypothetical protein